MRPSLKIFCVYFDNRPVWRSDCVEPVQAGRARTGIRLEMLGDDGGDSISAENDRYGEMTAWYWVWKNWLPAHPEADYVGFSHYRRFLDFTGSGGARTRRMTYSRFRRLFDRHYREAEIRRQVEGYDLVMRRVEESGYPTLRDQLLDWRPENVADWDRMVGVLHDFHPESRAAVDGALGSGLLAMELQFVMRRAVFEDFMKWSFALCRESERRAPWSEPPEGGDARVPAFLIERLFMTYLAMRRQDASFRVLELPLVKLTGRPWWFRLVKPFLAFAPREFSRRIFGKYK